MALGVPCLGVSSPKFPWGLGSWFPLPLELDTSPALHSPLAGGSPFSPCLPSTVFSTQQLEES